MCSTQAQLFDKNKKPRERLVAEERDPKQESGARLMASTVIRKASEKI